VSGQAPTFRLNFEEALRFIWRDPRWLSKLALGALFSLLSFVVVGAILMQGYLLIMAGRVARQEERPLPEWEDWGEILRQGFGAFLVGLILLVPLIIVGFLIFLLFLPLIAAGSSGGQAAGGLAAGASILIAFLSLLFVPLALLVGIVVPAAYAQLILHEGDLAAAFRFREVFGFIGRHKGQYALMLLLSYAVSGFLSQLGYFACFVGIFPTLFMAQLFQYHLIGQLCWFDRTVLNAPSRGEG
jgi:hypothetical protein